MSSARVAPAQSRPGAWAGTGLRVGACHPFLLLPEEKSKTCSARFVFPILRFFHLEGPTGRNFKERKLRYQATKQVALPAALPSCPLTPARRARIRALGARRPALARRAVAGSTLAPPSGVA